MAGTFNQSLQCTQDVFVGFQAPSPPVRGGGEKRGELGFLLFLVRNTEVYILLILGVFYL